MIKETNPVVIADILALVGAELQQSQSRQEVQRKLARMGYQISETNDGPMLATLPHGVTIAPIALPASVSV